MRLGQHVREVRAVVGNLIDIEEDRAWDVVQFEFAARIKAFVGEVPRGVHDTDIRCRDMLGEPFGLRPKRSRGVSTIFLLQSLTSSLTS